MDSKLTLGHETKENGDTKDLDITYRVENKTFSYN